MIRSLRFLPILLILCAACRPAGTSTPSMPTCTSVPSPVPTARPSLPPPSATATEPALPGPRSFTEEFNGALPDWAFLQIDNGHPIPGPSAEGGFLVFDLNDVDQWVYALYGAQDYADVRLDARVEFRTGEDESAGVVCRYGEKQGWFEFNVYPDQTYTLMFGQWLAQDVARFTPLYRGTSEKIAPDADEIGLLCKGSALTPFINGVQMRIVQVAKYPLQDGKVGLSASSFDKSPVMAAYDWVKVSEP